MNKGELIAALAAKIGSKKDSEKFLDAFVETVTEALANYEKVQLVGFGTFEVRDKASREARNPLTGETLFIPAKKAPAFKPGKALKDAINK